MGAQWNLIEILVIIFKRSTPTRVCTRGLFIEIWRSCLWRSWWEEL